MGLVQGRLDEDHEVAGGKQRRRQSGHDRGGQQQEGGDGDNFDQARHIGDFTPAHT